MLWWTSINLTLFQSQMKCSISRHVDISRLCMHLISLHQKSISWYVFMIIKTALLLCNIIYKYLKSLVLACESKLIMTHTIITIKWRWMLFWGLQCISSFETVHLIFDDARNVHILTFCLRALKSDTLCTFLKALFSLTLLSRSAFYHLSESLWHSFFMYLHYLILHYLNQRAHSCMHAIYQYLRTQMTALRIDHSWTDCLLCLQYFFYYISWQSWHSLSLTHAWAQ